MIILQSQAKQCSKLKPITHKFSQRKERGEWKQVCQRQQEW